MPDITDFQVGQGETFKILVQLQNRSDNNTPLNITDYTFTGQVRENYTTDEVAATFTFEKAIPYTSGSLYIMLPSTDTVQLNQRKYVYDVYISSGSTQPIVRRILEGGLTIRPAVTR